MIKEKILFWYKPNKHIEDFTYKQLKGLYPIIKSKEEKISQVEHTKENVLYVFGHKGELLEVIRL